MKYERPLKRESQIKEFELGTHAAVIEKFKRNGLKKGMICFTLFWEKVTKRGLFSYLRE